MSDRSGKLFSIILAASFASGAFAVTTQSPARADDTCLSAPKAATPHGSHWYYRVEAGTKRHCWYLGEERGKTADAASAKPSSPAVAPDKPARTSGATPLQPSVADAHAEVIGAAATGNQTTASATPSQTPAPSTDTTQGGTPPASLVATRWPDPATSLAQPQPAPPVAAKPASQLLGERTEPGPAVRVISAPPPVPQASLYSMPMLLGGLAGALTLAGCLGFAVVKFGSLNRFNRIHRRPESIWDTDGASQPPPWQARDMDAAPTSSNDTLRTRREIEAQSRDILEILSRASRRATT
jgi:hypothetical protein